MLVLVVAATLALPADILAQVPATVTRAIDGDSIEVRATIWPDLTASTQIRVAGVDAPELRRPQCDAERALAERARDRTAALTDNGVVLVDPRLGKFAGRVVAQVILPDGRNLADVLIAEGLGRAYDGGRRKGWCG